MQPKNKNIILGVVIGVVVITIALAAFWLGRSSSDSKSTTTTVVSTATVTSTTPTRSTGSTTQTNPPAPSSGPYTSMSAAVSFVEAQEGGMSAIDPATTWQPGATLNVIHATPTGTASYGGDFYFFFVNGYLVGQETFTSAVTSQIIDAQTFAVTFNVYLPTDPHCCPTGGTSTVQFWWDGGSIVTIGSMDGATM